MIIHNHKAHLLADLLGYVVKEEFPVTIGALGLPLPEPHERVRAYGHYARDFTGAVEIDELYGNVVIHADKPDYVVYRGSETLKKWRTMALYGSELHILLLQIIGE